MHDGLIEVPVIYSAFLGKRESYWNLISNLSTAHVTAVVFRWTIMQFVLQSLIKQSVIVLI